MEALAAEVLAMKHSPRPLAPRKGCIALNKGRLLLFALFLDHVLPEPIVYT